MDILFIPFLTNTQNGYSRVKICAQSAVFTPCDFAFPPNGIKAESTPNTKMILVADVDLELLKELHSLGSVTNLKDRRTDIYEIELKK